MHWIAVGTIYDLISYVRSVIEDLYRQPCNHYPETSASHNTTLQTQRKDPHVRTFPPSSWFPFHPLSSVVFQFLPSKPLSLSAEKNEKDEWKEKKKEKVEAQWRSCKRWIFHRKSVIILEHVWKALHFLFLTRCLKFRAPILSTIIVDDPEDENFSLWVNYFQTNQCWLVEKKYDHSNSCRLSRTSLVFNIHRKTFCFRID